MFISRPSPTGGVRQQLPRVACAAAATILLLGVMAGSARAQCPDRFVMAPDDRTSAFGIGVLTGNVSGAGTDADIYVKLYGANQETEWIKIDPPGNSFERGSWDCATVFLKSYLPAPLRIAIKNNGGGTGPDWFLGRVCVSPMYAQEPCNQKTTHNFEFNTWLGPGVTTLVTSATNPPDTPIVPVPPVARQVVDPHQGSFTLVQGANPDLLVQAAPGQPARFVRVTESVLAQREFRLVPGLAGRGHSIESVNHPGHYLRHAGFQVFLHPNDGSDLYKQDATFMVRGALDGTAGAWSWNSINYPDRWIVAAGELLALFGAEMRSALDATFRTMNAR